MCSREVNTNLVYSTTFNPFFQLTTSTLKTALRPPPPVFCPSLMATLFFRCPRLRMFLRFLCLLFSPLPTYRTSGMLLLLLLLLLSVSCGCVCFYTWRWWWVLVQDQVFNLYITRYLKRWQRDADAAHGWTGGGRRRTRRSRHYRASSSSAGK